jgi:formylmethanofuran dehydrogenase subunit E
VVIIGATFAGRVVVHLMCAAQAFSLVLLCRMVRRQSIGMRCNKCGEEIFARDVNALNYKATTHGCGN